MGVKIGNGPERGRELRQKNNRIDRLLISDVQ